MERIHSDRLAFSPMRKLRPLSLTLLTIGLVTSGCSGGGSGVVAVVDSWAPGTPPGAQAAAIYLTIDNGTTSDDRLVAVASNSCEAIELHATQIDDDRIMRMRLAEPELLVVPAGDELEMLPGGLHVMCIAMTDQFVIGDQLELTVTLEEAGDLAVTTPIENR